MIVMYSRWSISVLASLLTSGLALAACADGSGPGQAAVGRGDGELRLVASFYPLQWAAEQVAGKGADVRSLTKPGAEPHDLELTPQDVAAMADADLIVYLGGFQPAVDAAVEQEGGEDRALDVSKAADLNLTYTPIEEGDQHAEEADATDPHFWLDPVRVAAVADAVATHLRRLDPERAREYQANAAILRGKLENLDGEFRAGLADCASTDLVTSHNAFGYLAQRYGLTQVGITGLTPEDEPKPGDLAAVTAFVRAHKVQTIYYETLVSPAIAETVAGETGARTAVLDPIEGLTDDSKGADYLEVMRANLANIRAGQACS
jgi:zinc transport system substrate-binding protein